MKPLQVVVAIIRNPRTGQMLFQEREKPPYKGHLGLVGGKVEPNEPHDEALVREVKEETSLEVNKLEYVHVIHETLVKQDSKKEVALHVYLVEAQGIIMPSLDEGQVHWLDDMHFNSRKELYIPTDWLIVNAVLNEGDLFGKILIEDKGENYEIKSID
jgi:ADP-ribose pyrophosphatase YjhB (NUDIX family)